MPYPTPHYEKLNATLNSDKLPQDDKPRVEMAIERYEQWIIDLETVINSDGEATLILAGMVELLNDYRRYIDIELVFNSPSDFLYRQKGQLKLDNSVIEEFLPRLIHPALMPEIDLEELVVGPVKAFAAIYFESGLDIPEIGGGMQIRTKDQDFAISKRLFLRASHSPTFEEISTIKRITNLAYVVAECKTNLDKTMFQEAVATAHDVTSAIPGAKYYLLCEWLDMIPISTAPTDIEEVLILRKAKRLGASVRKNYDKASKRQAHRKRYEEFLIKNPLRVEMFQRFINHIRRLLSKEAPEERDVLAQGYF
jgi:hypothetical protein